MVEFNRLVKKGIDRSVRRGVLNQIRHGLDIKFPQDADRIFADIQQIPSLHGLKMIENQLYHLQTVEELRLLYRNLL
ncbi:MULTISPECIES: hypothetical protein [Cyanophyceae]|uniref:hypothetical protein n=1 Tax=Cyanophyceae TaxID=3028117 RepID=UPI00016DC54B|nr:MULTISPECIES: hypothetical protein [Cyanophyceae]ACA98036.1 conserved hypothetical protein [Picosynechococcus sp. PCC 7002]SMH42452.1 hypothetical protein SAMN06272755_1296 [Picosynechococcus sp. OG1]SMQ78747.1 hypothetical protein SAMN06272774_0578 [Synechococcus sp. 7002]